MEEAKQWIAEQSNPPFEAQVDIAQDELGLKAFFQTAKEAGMTDKEYEVYLQSIESSKQAAVVNQKDKALRQQKKELEQEWQLELSRERGVAQEELSSQPVYQAIHGIGADRLNRQDVEAIAQELGISLDDLPTQTGGRKLFATTKGESTIPVDVYAELHGYDDAVSMIEDMLTAPDYATQVERVANQRMAEKHGDINTLVDGINEARKSLHTDEQLSVLVMEVNALRKATKDKRLTPQLIRAAAREFIATLPLTSLTSAKLMQNHKRLAQQARSALKAGKTKEAASLKFQQVMNFEAFKQAQKVTKQIEAQRKKVSKYNRNRKTNNKMPNEALEAIRDILSQVNLSNRRGTKGKSAKKGVMDRKVDPVNLPDFLKTDGKKFWKDMTVGEWNEMVNVVEAIAHKGREVNKLRSQSKEQLVDEIGKGIYQQAEVNLKKSAKVMTEDRNRWTRMKQDAKELLSMALNMDTVLRIVDGFTDLGYVYTNTKGRIDRALAQGYHPGQVGYLRRQQAEAIKLSKLFDVWTADEKKSMHKSFKVDGLGERKINHKTLLAVLLNSGNEGNITAMLEGGNFTKQELNAIWRHASKKDWDFAQSVWDYLATFQPEIVEATKRRNNTVPEMVNGDAIKTLHGTYKGGYYPIRYDSTEAMSDVFHPDTAEKLINEVRFGSFTASHTADGHLKARSNPGVEQVSMDLFTLNTHVDQVIYDLEVGDAIADFYKVWFNENTKAAFRDHGAMHYWEYGELWLRDAITQEVGASNAIYRAARHLRTSFTASKLAFNVSVAVTQVAGLSQTSVVIGRKHMWKGIRTFLGAKWTGKDSVLNVVARQSGFMATRQENWNKDVLDAQKAMAEGTLLDRVTPGSSATFIRDTMFWGIKKMQMIVDMMTWLGGLSKGMEQFNGDYNKAVDYADRAVSRSQGSGVFTERTAFERGTIGKGVKQNELVRSFTPLISYFAAKYNIAYERTKQTKFTNPGNLAVWAWDMVTLYLVDALIAGILTGQVPFDDDDDESVGHWILAQGVSALAAGVPFAREAVSAARGFPAGGIGGAVAKYIGNAYDQVTQGDIDEALIKGTSNLMGVFFKWPSAAVNKIITNANNVSEGDDVTPQEWIFGSKYKGK
jgi:hypothetical protein